MYYVPSELPSVSLVNILGDCFLPITLLSFVLGRSSYFIVLSLVSLFVVHCFQLVKFRYSGESFVYAICRKYNKLYYFDFLFSLKYFKYFSDIRVHGFGYKKSWLLDIMAVISSQTLADLDRAYRVAQPAKETILKKADDYFREDGSLKTLFRKGRWAKAEDKLTVLLQKEVALGSVGGNEQVDLTFPLIEMLNNERPTPQFDSRLPYREQEKDQKKSLFIGAVEVAIEGLASTGSDLCMGSMLLDTRHKSLDNAFKGSFVTKLNGQMNRVIFHPATRLKLSEINSLNKLMMSSCIPENDMQEGCSAANLRVSLVGELNNGFHQDHHTKKLDKWMLEDKALAIEYATTNIIVDSAGVNTDPLKPVRILAPHYGSTEAARRSVTLNSDGVVRSWRPSNVIQMQGDNGIMDTPTEISEPKNLDLLPNIWHDQFESTSVLNAVANIKNLTWSQRHLGSGDIEVKQNSTANTYLGCFNIGDMLSLSDFGMHLRMLGDLPGGFTAEIEGTISRELSILLMAAWVEEKISGDAGMSMETMLPCSGHVWAPNFENTTVCHFIPQAGLPLWNAEAFMKQGCQLHLATGSNWTSAPSHGYHLAVKIFYNPDLRRPDPKTLMPPRTLPMRRFMGQIEISVGRLVETYKFPLNLGMPLRKAGNKIMFPPDASSLALHGFASFDVEIELVKYSTMFVAATIGMCVMPASLAFEVPRSTLNSLPHVSVNFADDKGRKSAIVNLKHLGLMCSTQQTGIGKLLTENHAPYYLMLWIKDSVSNSQAKPLRICVNMLSIRNVQVMGPPRNYPTIAQSLKDSSVACSEVVRLRINLFKGNMTMTINLATGAIEHNATDDNLKKQIFFASSTVSRILMQHAWLSGKLHIRAFHRCEAISLMQSKFHGTMALCPYGPKAGFSDIIALTGLSNVYTGTMDIVGFNQGYHGKSAHNEWAGDPCIKLHFKEIEHLDDFSLFIGLDENFKYAGNMLPKWENITTTDENFIKSKQIKEPQNLLETLMPFTPIYEAEQVTEQPVVNLEPDGKMQESEAPPEITLSVPARMPLRSSSTTTVSALGTRNVGAPVLTYPNLGQQKKF